jgi:hypothetical protein
MNPHTAFVLKGKASMLAHANAAVDDNQRLEITDDENRSHGASVLATMCGTHTGKKVAAKRSAVKVAGV